MPFNLFEVWKSVETVGGEPRRGIIDAVNSDGSTGRLFLDNGNSQSVSWPLHEWQLDTSPKPTRSADQLKQLILRHVQAQPACPDGMSVEIRGTSDSDWEALSVPPPGSHIGYADCAGYISSLARAYRSLYALPPTPGGESTPVGWMNSGEDAANTIVRMGADRQRSFIAATQSGAVEPVFPHTPQPIPTALAQAIEPILPQSPEPSASTAPSVVEAAARGSSFSSGRASAVVSPGPGGRVISETLEEKLSIEQRLSVEQKLSERPVDIREAAQALSAAIADHIGYLNASKPNEPESLARQSEFIEFLRGLAAGLDGLADSIDCAIRAGSAASPEPVLLGKAAEIARRLSVFVTEGLDRNRTYIADCTIKFSLAGAGFMFLHACGFDGYIAGFVAALMNVKLPIGGKTKK